MAAGAVDVTIEAMRAHRRWPATQQWGCRALLNLAFGSDAAAMQRKRLIHEAGGAHAVADAMAAHPDDAAIQLWGCRALLTIAVGPLPATADAGAGAGPAAFRPIKTQLQL